MSQGTVPTTAELFFRWTAFGALQPVMRTHHGRSATANFQWETDAGGTAHFRRWARLHMQLAAYQWGSVGSFDRDGLPLMRLVALEYPDEPWAWTAIDTYLLGDRVLVAPVQVAGATIRDLTLPAGRWFPLLGGTALDGGAHTVPAPVTELPAFVPAGALLVLYPDGVDTTHPAPALPAAVTTDAVGGDREVWLYPGTAARPTHATWNDEAGPAGAAQWTWTGRPEGAGALTTALFNGAPVAVTGDTVTVVGDGTLELAGGGTLTIARGLPSASVLVRLR